MRKTVYKWFWVWQFDKEEKWLNEMAARGLALSSMHFIKYIFEETEPGEYQVRLELLDNSPNHPESERYIRFIEETGGEQVASWINWVYFRKKTADGPFELFSDNSSRIKMLNRVLSLLTTRGVMCLLAGGYNLFLYFLRNAKDSEKTKGNGKGRPAFRIKKYTKKNRHLPYRCTG